VKTIGYEMKRQFTQIGNAVPPMFSYKVAQSVISYLKQEKTHSALSSLAKAVADPAIKAASLAMLAKAIV